MQSKVRRWVENYQDLQTLLEEISQIYWSKIENRED
jgi:hypothetical protein